MRKGEQTREMILERTAQLFSQQGYFGSSLSDIMEITGLEKGGIYNHFRGKDDLALQAFDYAISLVWNVIEEELVGKVNAADRLIAMVKAFRHFIEDPPLAGGCPLLNTSVECDDAHPALRDRARNTMTRWRKWIQKTVTRGIVAGEIRPGVDADTLATILITSLEGGIMMSKLYDDPLHIHRVIDYLTHYINDTIRA